MNATGMRRIFLAILLSFAVLCWVLPVLNGTGTLRGLDGIAGYMNHADIWVTKDPITALMYGFGDMVCHQAMGRSILINENQMYVCLRDISIITGIILGLILFESRIKEYSLHRGMLVIGLMLLMFAFAEWCLKQSGIVDSDPLRATTGILAGIGVAVFLNAFIEHNMGLGRGLGRD